jgi:hypothetical protein
MSLPRSYGMWLACVGLGSLMACGPALQEVPNRYERGGIELLLDGYPLRGLPPVRAHFIAVVRMPKTLYESYGGCFAERWDFGDGAELRRERHCLEPTEQDPQGRVVLEFFAEHPFYRPGTYEVFFMLRPPDSAGPALIQGRIRVAVLSQGLQVLFSLRA